MVRFWPPKYYAGLTYKQKLERKKEIDKYGSMDWKNPKAYIGFKTDTHGKRKLSGYTAQWRSRFPDASSLEEKAKATGVPLKFIKESYNRGLAAWRTGHRPGATPQQWGYARVHSFLLCGKTHYGPDSDIVKDAVTTSSAERWFQQCSKKTFQHPSRKMAKKHTKHVKRTRKHRGGAGSGYEPGGALLPGTQLDAQVVKPYDGCMSVGRPGQMAYSTMGGLPGMRGGGYTTNLSSGIAGFAQIDKLPCDAPLTQFNPMNKHFTQAGGLAKQSGGVGLQSAQDMGVYEASTARYSAAPSQWTNSVGAPVLLNPALDARMWSRACTQTAGGFLRKSQQKGKTNKSRKSKKSRKTKKSRKSRK